MVEPSSLGDALEQLAAERRKQDDQAHEDARARAQAVVNLDVRTGPLVGEFLDRARDIEPITFEMGSRSAGVTSWFGRPKEVYEPMMITGHLVYHRGSRPLPSATYFGKVHHGETNLKYPYVRGTRQPGNQAIIVATDGRVYGCVPWMRKPDDYLLAAHAHVPGFIAELPSSYNDGRDTCAFVSRGPNATNGQIAFHAAYRRLEGIDRRFDGLKAGAAEVEETISLLTNWFAIYLDQSIQRQHFPPRPPGADTAEMT